MENNTPVYRLDQLEGGTTPHLPRKYRRGFTELQPGLWVNRKIGKGWMWDARVRGWIEVEHVFCATADTPEEAERIAKVGAEVHQMKKKGFFD